ncbi:hypothetical protein P692DRAFT_201807349 [Suillus brevipes Sb2]|nr:hypothetical protein P692DRAFT_201807349 [Suillus brevipes Sb2]
MRSVNWSMATTILLWSNTTSKADSVAMFINPVMWMSWMDSLWEKDRVTEAKEFILKLMHSERAENANPAHSQPVEAPQPLPCTLGSRHYGLPMAHANVPHHHGGGQTASQSIFPTIFSIAMDYAPVQASAVPCDETHTKKRNHLSPVLMEALQMVKFLEHGVVYDMGSSEPLTSSPSANDALLRAIAEEECANIEDTAIIYNKLICAKEVFCESHE